jgi:hypothetical protein
MSVFKWLPMGVLSGVGYTQKETISEVAKAPIEMAMVVRTHMEISSIMRFILIDKNSDTIPRGMLSDFKGYLNKRLISSSNRDTSLDPWGNSYNIRIYQNEYEVWSYGPDLDNDTEDDIWTTIPLN